MCGILAYFSNSKSMTSQVFINKLKKLYHRGQDHIGISFICNDVFTQVKCSTFEELIEKTEGVSATTILGHTKYTTSGTKENTVNQPIWSCNLLGSYHLVYNGNIDIEYYDETNYENDTLMIIDYLNNKSSNYDTWEQLLQDFIENFERAFNIIIQTHNALYVVKDKYGVRPLTYNDINGDFVLSSESRIFDDNIKEIYAGSIIKIDHNGFDIIYNSPKSNEKHCLFEYIYFLHKDSSFENTRAIEFRENIGRLMGLRDKAIFGSEKDNLVVCGVPNTGNDYAISYAKYVEIPYKNYIVKNSAVNRTFILASDEERNKYANVKYLFDPDIKNKNIILVDDSIVRGITLKVLISNLKRYGVEKIYVVIASPPINDTCKYGIDIPTKEELIYTKLNAIELANEFHCEMVRYLDLKLLYEALPDSNKKCTDCLKTDPNLEW